VPLPWSADAPGFGFGPAGDPWLPQPASFARYAADAQYGVEGSTFETYRAALALRKAEGLGLGGLAWLAGWETSADVIALRNQDVVVVANLGAEPVLLPRGARVLLASGPVVTDRSADPQTRIPADTTVWLRA